MDSIKAEEITGAAPRQMKSIRLIVFILFFATGISGLVYEVVWTRQLTYLFGATLFAVATVLAAYMGGLALGSFLFGKKADQNTNNLRLFGFLEIGIGISALMLPFLLRLLDPIYKLAYQKMEASFIILSLLRFIMSFLVLLIPTTLMGGTLPVLSRFMVRQKDSLGLNVGALYSLNTFGAVLGCFLTGFILIAMTGIRGSTLLATGINILVGLAAIYISSGKEKSQGENAGLGPMENQAPESGEKAEDRTQDVSPLDLQKAGKILHAVLWSYAVSGFIALSYQVVWNRALVFTFEEMKNTTYSFTAMLTVFLIGLSLGGAVMSAFIDKQKNPLRLFALIQLLIGLSGGFSFFAIFYLGPGIAPFQFLNQSGDVNWWAGVMNVFAKTGVAIFLPTFLMGMAFPVVTKLCVDQPKAVGFGVGRLYSLNTIGSIAGSFAAGFILIPFLGVAGTIFLLATGNLLIALYLFTINPMLDKNARILFACICGAGILMLLVRVPLDARFQELSPTERMIFYKEGPLATASVAQNSFQYRTLYVDNVGVAGTDRILLTDQKSLAHIPMLLLKNPKTALTVGFGSGGASYSYTRFQSIEEIHCVEICKTVMDAAPDLLASNHGILLPINRPVLMQIPLEQYKFEAYPEYKTFDKRYKIIIDDVRSYLRFTGKKYDIIATDCTDLRYKSNANLYDFEYFRLCREHITEDGMVVVWMPLAGLSEDMFRLALRTFYSVFPEMSVWYMNNESTHYILLLGTPKPLRIDYALCRKKLEEEAVAKDLAELFLDDVDKILSCFLCDQNSLKSLLEGTKINTENRPFLEFESPKYGYGEQPMIDNLNLLLKNKASVLPYVDNVPDRKGFEAQIERYSEAVPHIIKGHTEYRGLRMIQACRSYMEAVRLCPEDRATRALLNFEEMKLRIAARPNDAWGYREIGAVFFEQKRYSEAVTYLSQLLTRATVPPEDASQETKNYYRESEIYANKTIGICYLAVGNPEFSRPYLKRALEMKPGDQEIQSLLNQTTGE